jgi:hypothetical protein
VPPLLGKHIIPYLYLTSRAANVAYKDEVFGVNKRLGNFIGKIALMQDDLLSLHDAKRLWVVEMKRDTGKHLRE